MACVLILEGVEPEFSAELLVGPGQGGVLGTCESQVKVN